MNLHVTLQFRAVYEPFSTETAFVRPLARVDPNVCFQVCLLRKTFSTNVTLVWLFTCVGSNVPCQTRAECETFPTSRAFVRPLSCVHPTVVLQRRGVCEPIPAVAARVRFLSRVNPRVLLQISFTAEFFSTGGTSVRLLARVSSHVVSYRGQLSKLFPARAALEGFFSGVSFRVSFQGRLLEERPFTVGAFKRLFTRVDSHVDFHVFQVRKGFTAVVTLVRFVFWILLNTYSFCCRFCLSDCS